MPFTSASTSSSTSDGGIVLSHKAQRCPLPLPPHSVERTLRGRCPLDMRSRAMGRRADTNWVSAMASVSTSEMVVSYVPSLRSGICGVLYGTAHRVCGRLHNQPQSEGFPPRAALGLRLSH